MRAPAITRFLFFVTLIVVPLAAGSAANGYTLVVDSFSPCGSRLTTTGTAGGPQFLGYECGSASFGVDAVSIPTSTWRWGFWSYEPSWTTAIDPVAVGREPTQLELSITTKMRGVEMIASIPSGAHALALNIFNILSRCVSHMSLGELAAGTHPIPWPSTRGDGQALGRGVYIAQLSSATARVSRRLLLAE